MERAAYRIIDANFNRAREALRVMEEYCRFALNCELFNSRTKQMRHELCRLVDTLDSGRMIATRDTLEDVGVGQQVKGQLKRTSLKDTFTAAAKRFTEALRALAEVIQPKYPEVYAELEKLRYAAYTLEKDVVVFTMTTEKFKNVRLYVVIISDDPDRILDLAQKCADGNADCIQLRSKQMSDLVLYQTAEQFVEICRQGSVLSIINDRPDIAVNCGADGLHLGQDDLPIDIARKLQTKPLIIGKSTHSIEQLKDTCSQMPAYVGLGPINATPTKPNAQPVGLEYIKDAVQYLDQTGIGHVAIGGISIENVDSVIKAGAKAVAVCRAVIDSGDPEKECKLLKQRIAQLLS